MDKPDKFWLDSGMATIAFTDKGANPKLRSSSGDRLISGAWKGDSAADRALEYMWKHTPGWQRPARPRRCFSLAAEIHALCVATWQANGVIYKTCSALEACLQFCTLVCHIRTGYIANGARHRMAPCNGVGSGVLQKKTARGPTCSVDTFVYGS